MTTEAIPSGETQPPGCPPGRPARRLAQIKLGLRDFFVHAIGQVRVLKKAYPGIMHLLIFWGVTIQVLGTAINLMQMQLFIPFVELPFPRGDWLPGLRADDGPGRGRHPARRRYGCLPPPGAAPQNPGNPLG